MSLNVLAALVAFAFVTSISPGPSNLMLLSAGATYGFKRTLPQIAGITFGFGTLLLAAGLGLGAVLSAVPALGMALKVVGGVYLLVLAWRIGTSRSIGAAEDSHSKPLSFAQSALFQWVNPKAWIVAATTTAVYSDPGQPFQSAALVTIAFAAVNLPSVALWAGFGLALRGILERPSRLRWFNTALGVVLALTLVPMVR